MIFHYNSIFGKILSKKFRITRTNHMIFWKKLTKCFGNVNQNGYLDEKFGMLRKMSFARIL